MSNAIKSSNVIVFKAKQDAFKGSLTYNPRLNAPGVHFTKRESECFYLLSRGYTGKKMARILGLSTRTIEMYINKIKEKMGLLYKSELTEKAIVLASRHLANEE